MSELVDRELDRLRRERDALDDANTKLGDQLIDARTERDEERAEVGQLRASQRMLLHDAVDHGRNHTAALVDCDDMSCAQARAALAPAPGPAGERI